MKELLQNLTFVILLSVFSIACSNTHNETKNLNLNKYSDVEIIRSTLESLDDVTLFDSEYIKYLNGLNQSLIDDNVLFRYLTYKYDNSKFTTYPFNLILEHLPTQDGVNPNYDKKYDESFQEMIARLDETVDLTNKELYAMGSHDEGMYVQDIDTDEMYILNRICFDFRCSAGQVFYLFEPDKYKMVGMKYDGCNFIKDNISGNNQRMKTLLESYIDSLEPLNYSYSPNICQ